MELKQTKNHYYISAKHIAPYIRITDYGKKCARKLCWIYL